jgi:hypothetical protein
MAAGDFDPNATTSGAGLITSSTPSFTGYPTYSAGEQPTTIPIVKTTKATESQLSSAYGKMSPILRRSLSQQLKDAGYKVPVTGEYSALVRDQFLQSNRDLSEEITILSANDPKRLETVSYDLTTYLKDKANDVARAQDTGPSVQKSASIYTDDQARAYITNAFKKYLNTEPTPDELIKLTKELQNAQKKNPSVTKYRTLGGVQEAITTPGLDEAQFVLDIIQKDPRYDKKQQEKLLGSRTILAATAKANGLNLDTNFGIQVDDFLNRIKNGEDIKNIQNLIRQQGRLFLPESVRNAIDPSIDLSSALGIYVNDYAKSKGVSADMVDINEVIPLAITDKGFAPISDFRKAKRKLAWWPETEEAITEAYQSVGQVFKNFGIMGAL